MSGCRLYRNSRRFNCVTPKSPTNSPQVEYYTPDNIKKDTENDLAKTAGFNRMRLDFSKTPRRLSAECFRHKEKVKNRFFFYVRSPRTPLYKRCQVVKKKLIFDDDDSPIAYNKAMTKDDKSYVNPKYLRPNIIPKIVLTSPKEYGKDESFTSLMDNDPGFYINSFNSNVISPDKLKLIQSIYTSFPSHQILGRGRYGYVVEDEYKGTKVAVKLIDMANRGLRGCLKHENNGLGLSHVNVIETLFILIPKQLQIERYALVVMQHVHKGFNLQTLLDGDYDDRFLTPQYITRYTLDICEGLRYLHSENILHLDIKPKNILVDPVETCKLCDYGMSVYCGTKISWDKRLRYQIHGTVQYTAPEIFLGQIPSVASDVYSLGITMWQILHRTVPYGNTIREESLIYQIVKENLRPTITKNSNFFQKTYCGLYKMCWAQHPSLRCSIEYVSKHLYDYWHSVMPIC